MSSSTVIQVEDLSKQYRLGQVGKKTLHDDLNRFMHRIVGKEDPYLKIGDVNDRSTKGNSEYVWALKDINFSVQQGDILGIIGRNGAGKSTLLKILSKVTTPTTGNVKVKGRIAALLEVGTGFHPELSGRDNIFLNGAILGMTKKEIHRKFDEIVAFAGVERYIDTPVKRYSSGMYVRLAFAVAAHLEPDILIVDEVLAVGDAEFQKKCLGKMKDVSEKEGRTVLFVSHNMPAILNLCTKLVLLENGNKQFEGDVEKGIDLYLNQRKSIPTNYDTNFESRLGNGIVRFNKVDFLNTYMDAVDTFKSGDVLNIKINYKLRNSEVRNVLFRIQIVDKNEQIIFTCNNEHSVGLINAIKNNGSVICTIPKLPLFEGIYYINIQIFSKDMGLLDEADSIKELIVIDGDFFNTGKIPFLKKGVLVDHNWSFDV